MPDQRERVTCETLDDARRVAYLCAARRRPCELIVCDAYHRVLHHEFINGRGGSAGTDGRGEGLAPVEKRWSRACGSAGAGCTSGSSPPR